MDKCNDNSVGLKGNKGLIFNFVAVWNQMKFQNYVFYLYFFIGKNSNFIIAENKTLFLNPWKSEYFSLNLKLNKVKALRVNTWFHQDCFPQCSGKIPLQPQLSRTRTDLSLSTFPLYSPLQKFKSHSNNSGATLEKGKRLLNASPDSL